MVINDSFDLPLRCLNYFLLQNKMININVTGADGNMGAHLYSLDYREVRRLETERAQTEWDRAEATNRWRWAAGGATFTFHH